MGGGGGGGGTSVDMRDPKQEQKTVGNWYGFQQGQFNDFFQNQPLLNAGQQGALGFWQQLPQMLGQFGGLQNELNRYQSQLGADQRQLGGLSRRFGNVYRKAGTQIAGQRGLLQNLYGQVGQLTPSFGQYLGPNSALSQALAGTINPVLQTGGALTSQQGRNVAQQTRAIASQQGNARSVGALGQELLNRDEYRQQRFNQALAQSQGVLGQQAGAAGALQNIFGQQAGLVGQQSGLTGLLANIGQNTLGQQAGIVGQKAGLTGLGAGLTGQQAGLLGQQQALQTGGLNQLLGVQNAATGNFTGLTNPVLGYLGNLFGGNQQASIAQAQINAQQQQAADSKTSGAIGGGVSAIGSIAMAAL